MRQSGLAFLWIQTLEISPNQHFIGTKTSPCLIIYERNLLAWFKSLFYELYVVVFLYIYFLYWSHLKRLAKHLIYMLAWLKKKYTD